MSKKKLFIILGVVVALIVLLVIGKKAGWFGNSANVKQVEIAEIDPINITETVSATGKIQPEVEVKLSSEVSGEIIELPIVEGQAVEKGDLLVRVNPDIYQSSVQRAQASYQNSKANYAQTQANLKQAKADYERNKKLFEKGVISKAEWDGIVSNYEMAEANKESSYYSMQSSAATVTEAQDNLGRTNIYAPMSGTISNLAGGVLIIVLKPFKVGDWIEAQGVSGSVVEISLFYTKINTFGNQRVVIPNGELSNDNITNYSYNSTRKEALTFGISYDDDIKKAKEVLTNMVMEQEDVLKDPAPQIIVHSLGDNSVNFSVRYFAELSVFWDLHWYMIEEGKIRLEEAGMTIPYPQRDVYLYDQTKMKGTVREKKSE